jgi:hypothetical protein
MMVYKKKLLLLSALVGLLVLIYGGSLIFSPDRMTSRGASFVWLESRWLDQVDRIEISGLEPIDLIRQNNQWMAEYEGVIYPAKQTRIEDLLRLLATRGLYPVRATSSASHERLGITEDAAARLIVRGGAGLPLLDLLVGDVDATGEVYLRKNNQDEVRSGEDRFSTYLLGRHTSWYNLRLFPDNGELGLDMIQRITVSAPASEEAAEGSASQGLSYTLARNAGGWTLNDAEADTVQVESYIRAILDTEGSDFAPAMTPSDPVFNDCRILLEIGNGTTRTIRLSPAAEEGADGVQFRYAVVSGSSSVYTITEWAANRLLRDPIYFEKQ